MTRTRARNASHGTRSKYTTGCRCDDCRAANTAYQWVGRHAPEHLADFRPLMNAEASAQKRARAAARRQAREEAAA